MLSIIGTGWVGTVSAATFAARGLDALGFDIDQEKIVSLRKGVAPFAEPNLNTLLKEGIEKGKLHFTSDATELAQSAIAIICVQTPERDGAPDHTALHEAVKMYASVAPENALIVVKSTVPPGTVAGLRSLSSRLDIRFATNPEFLAEGTAVEDALKPSRIIIGVDDESAALTLRDLYRPWIESGTPFIAMSVVSAELAKMAANSLLMTKISFANEIADLAEAVGASPSEVLQSLGHDPRIGKGFLRSGLGFGGGCFPKDLQTILWAGKNAGSPLRLLETVRMINAERTSRYTEKIRTALGGELTGKTIAILGLAFKPNTDDTRDAPAVRLIETLSKEGATIRAYDPMVRDRLSAQYPTVHFVDSIESCVAGADVAVIATEWAEIVEWKKEARILVVDGRPA